MVVIWNWVVLFLYMSFIHFLLKKQSKKSEKKTNKNFQGEMKKELKKYSKQKKMSKKNFQEELWIRPCLVRKTGMEWNQDLNLGGLGMELESWAQLFGENWNGIRSYSLLFGEQFWNGINSIFILKILYASMNIYNNNNIYYNKNNNYYNNNKLQ